MNDTMLAAVLHGIKDLRVEERPRPELLPGQVLLRIRRAGICGTDVHYFQEGRFGNFAMTAPFTLGHEVTGEVVAVGRGKYVEGKLVEPEVKVGDTVIYSKYGGTEVTIADVDYVILDEDSILAIKA